MLTKFLKASVSLRAGVGALAVLALAGCGGSGNTNKIQVIVSVAPSVIVSQSITATATVTGATDTTISAWACAYFTTVVDSTGKNPKNSADQKCTADTGTIPDGSTGTTVTYTAPNKVPDPTKLPGTNCAAATPQTCGLTLRLTATAHADGKTTGNATFLLNSGIAVGITPSTATVPTSEQQPFTATVSNDIDPQNQGVNWLVTQDTNTSVSFPAKPTCSPGCGTITSNTPNSATYTAPSTLPTTVTLTVVATSKGDPTRFNIGTITIIQGGPINFNGISPTIAPQGASLYSIYLDAPNISSASIITLTSASNSQNNIVLNSESNQFKVLFPIPTSSTTAPGSTGARVSLTAANLAKADTYTVTVQDPGQPVTNGPGPFTFQVVPVRPTTVASIPDSISQNATGNDLNLAIDGGYFGPNGALAKALFNGNALEKNIPTSSSRQLNTFFQTGFVNSVEPGLYPLSVTRQDAVVTTPNNPSVTNIAVFPDYSAVPPSIGNNRIVGAGPSAMDIDTRLGILVVAETLANQVEFFAIGANSLTPVACPIATPPGCAVNAPTGVSINQTNHTVAVASPQDQQVVVFQIPDASGSLPANSGAPGVTYPLKIALAGLVSSLPYSVGVDSDTNMALVAFSSSATTPAADVGFLLDLNKDSQTCLNNPVLTQTAPPCVFSQVTLNTGKYPQVAMIPHQHTAFVTPGGSGVINGVDVTKPSSSLAITAVSLISGLVTVTVNVPTGQILGLNPGNPGSVLIQGVPQGANGTVFNGVFAVQSVPTANSFTYALNSSVNDSATGDSDSAVFFSTPNLLSSISQTLQGIAFNPITRTIAMADANATSSSQIDLLRSTDLQISSISFHADCTGNTTTCSGAPELLGTSSVAFQPYTNLLVSYNPQLNQVSISNPTTLQRASFVCNVSSGCLTNWDASSLPNFQAQIKLPGTGPSQVTFTPSGGASTNLTLFGAVAVDPATNQAFVAMSGSNEIRIIPLAGALSTNMKPVEITELQVPTVPGAQIGGIAGALMPQGTLTSTTPLAGVQIFGSGFTSGTQVFLDGTALPSGNVAFVNSRVLNVTIPASFLSFPHRYAVTVSNGSGASNATDFFVIQAVDLSKNAVKPVCKDSSGNGLDAQPSAVAIADQLPGQGFAPIAVVTNRGCGNIVMIDINPANAGTTFGGIIKNPIPTGSTPIGVAVSQRYGIAVVTNNADSTASVLDLIGGTQKVPAVAVGSLPMGVAITDDTGVALVANSGTNTVSEINFAPLFPSPGSTATPPPTPPTTLTAVTIGVDTTPIAVAIDPDRGTNNRGLAVVTALALVNGGSALGVLDAVDIGGATPAKATSGASGGSTSASPTGVVFDPSVSPRLFYAVSSGGNLVTAFNPDTGGTSNVRVGINPTSLALNPQTGGIMTVNFTGQTVSIIDTVSNPFTTRRTFGLRGSAQFGVAIDQFTNLAVLADQANNRVLIFPMPN